MINVIIQNQNNGVNIYELPKDYYNLNDYLWSSEIHKSLSQMFITDDEDAEFQVKLYADNDIGNHLIRLFGSDNSLYDVYSLTSSVINANSQIKDELYLRITQDQYASPDEVFDDIRQMLYDAGLYTETFYFPLTGRIYDEEYGDDYQVSNYHLQVFEREIKEKLEIYQDRKTLNMADYYKGLGHMKLLLADWGLEYIGNDLYGKVDVRLTEMMTPKEAKNLKEWICGQNSDGFGEGFEQQNIETEDGTLNVSFWNSRYDYFIYDRAEMDEYTGGQLSQEMRGM